MYGQTSLVQRKKISVTNVVKEEFKDIELRDGGGLNLMVIRDTQSSRKIDFYGQRGVFFLTLGFKDVLCNRQKKRPSPSDCLGGEPPKSKSGLSAGPFSVMV